MPAHHLIDLAPPVEKAFLVAVDTGTEDGWTAQDSLAELANLATTAGAEVVGAEWQNRRHVDPNWYVGKGKAEDLVAAKSETAASSAGMPSTTRAYRPCRSAHDASRQPASSAIASNAPDPIRRSIAGPTTNGPIPIASSLNRIEAASVAST